MPSDLLRRYTRTVSRPLHMTVSKQALTRSVGKMKIPLTYKEYCKYDWTHIQTLASTFNSLIYIATSVVVPCSKALSKQKLLLKGHVL